MSAGPATQPDPLVGTFVGSYRVERRLGEGGMGAVYELLHPGIGKRLALKLLHAEYAARPQIVQRFFDEARAVNVIGHPNIVDIMDFSELPDGRRYILMEFLEGESLSDAIERCGPMQPDDVAAIGVSICSALEAAHQAGIVHRDLKPENVHLVPRPDNPRYVKVLDFGIAKLSSELHMDPGAATRSGVVMGTPSYMSPEQAMGRTKEIDARTDVYALGIILYEMLVGRVPFAAASFGDLMLKHLQEPPRPVREMRPELPPAWEQVIQIALAKQREQRFQSMAEMADAIQAAASGHAVAAPAQAAMTSPTANLARQGGGGGTLPYQSSPTGAPHAVAPYPTRPPSAADAEGPATAGSKLLLFATLSVIAVATVVIVVFIVRSKGGDKAAAGPASIDAAPPSTRPVATAPVDAAIRAQAPPPDAAPLAAAPADAAPVRTPGPKKPTVRKKPTRTAHKGTGTVRVLVAPWANVYVRGKLKGQTPITLPLPAGRHKLKLVNRELGKTEYKTVRVTSGSKQVVRRNWE